MRISDWITDVWSSVLRGVPRHAPARRRSRHLQFRLSRAERAPGIARARGQRARRWRRAAHTVGPDRQNVVWGKSVSVRVDLCGRRIIIKKNSIVEMLLYGGA